jgi:poly-gamma-glutamate synthesis protein (capsule biosynthesis protein)
MGSTHDRRSGPGPTRYRAHRFRASRSIALLAVALVAVTIVAAVALAIALTPRGAGGGSAAAPAAAHTTPGTASAGHTSPATVAVTTPPVTVVSGGDTMADRRVKTFIEEHGADAVFAGIAPLLRSADVAWVNLESPLTTISDPWPGKDVHFQGDPRLAAGLADAGVDLVNMANNHAVDQGPAGLLDSIRRLERAGVAVVGAGRNDAAARRPVIVRTSAGATVGFLGFTDIIWPGYAAGVGPGVATASPDMARVERTIRELKRRVDYVVVCFHWGIEYTDAPIASQVAEAHAAIDAGADLVIGHHPHVLQGVQLYRGRLIAYSLGDLVFDHYSVATGQTVLVDATLLPRGVRVTLVPVYASADGIPAVVTGAAGRGILLHMQQLSKALGTRVTILGDRGFVRSAGA